MVHINRHSTFLNLLASTSAANNLAYPYDTGFDIQKVVDVALQSSSHSWEYGVAAEALLELYNPELSVFGAKPFPVPTVQKDSVQSLAYASTKIEIGDGVNGLSTGSGSVGDPASLGVSAVLLGKTDQVFADASSRQVVYMTQIAPRYSNGAISHRSDVAELWADFMYMGPPFLAYYAADTNDEQLFLDAINQARTYRQILQPPTPGNCPGTWRHIIGPESQDTGLWSTGNSWAAAGMTRILATLNSAPIAQDKPWRQDSINDLTSWIKEILDGVRSANLDGGLLRNYLDNQDANNSGFGETSGSSLLASVAYRMAVMRPDIFGSEYVDWADGIRETLGGYDSSGVAHVQAEGIVAPAVNPLNWLDKDPYLAGSPEGQSMVALMYAAWRDCVLASKCQTWRRGTEVLHNNHIGGRRCPRRSQKL
ncbi:hypothetical protein BDN72DRAFT_861999 [Pluteus cervinus]|uniref:Uncharacterized protein n=1 Tax=Pluteus cervinus TaxID=181527 RepID=A0ACD3ADY1_9AGAR|nr:hypothetical protein BDN72DRAFT_861999 [Pluteus cervinus]